MESYQFYTLMHEIKNKLLKLIKQKYF